MKHSLVPLFLFLVLGVQAADLKLATGDMELTFTKVSAGYQTPPNLQWYRPALYRGRQTGLP